MFHDNEDDDRLIWTVVSSATGVALASITDSTLKITPLNVGVTTITITATDSNGESVTTSFIVTIQPLPNRSPIVANPITNQSGMVGEGDITVDVSETFTDQDGDPLTITAISNNESIATVVVNGANVIITPIGQGTTSITISASDGIGTVAHTFDVAVTENQAPVVSKPISDITNEIISTITVDLTTGPTFTDANGDSLTYTVNTPDGLLVSVSEANGIITIIPNSNVEGIATIHVEVSEGKGGSVTDTFTVAVDTLAPSAPTNVVASSPIMPELVTVSWTVSNSADVVYQRLEFNNNGNWLPLITFSNNTTNSYNYYMMTPTLGFRIVAIDNVGNATTSDSFTLEN